MSMAWRWSLPGCGISGINSARHPCACHRIQQRRVCGAWKPFHAKDFAWLDSCDKHRNDEGSLASIIDGGPPDKAWPAAATVPRPGR
ncbi:hypothetical protein FDR95_19025 [Rhizobiaceae bacterium LC148]|nr:hypothetical protein FDR95_19025 [Rhizobiaceae bacterium LC148]